MYIINTITDRVIYKLYSWKSYTSNIYIPEDTVLKKEFMDFTFIFLEYLLLYHFYLDVLFHFKYKIQCLRLKGFCLTIQ